MNFSAHIDKVTATVNKKIGWVLRTFRNRDKHFMKTMWKQILQPHIDYCSQLYFTGQGSDLERLENLQKTFTSKINQVQDCNYWDRLGALKINSIERRIERYRVIYTWKILEGLAPNCGVNSHMSDRNGRLCDIPPLNKKSTKRIQTLKEKSFNKWT